MSNLEDHAFGASRSTQTTHHESLAESVLKNLSENRTSTESVSNGDLSNNGISDPDSDMHRAKRQRNAWKGGGDISGHFEYQKKFEPDSSRVPKSGTQKGLVNAGDCRFVINVSSMEGKFYRRKLATHPVL